MERFEYGIPRLTLQFGKPLEGHTAALWSVGYSPDGRHIISGSADRRA